MNDLPFTIIETKAQVLGDQNAAAEELRSFLHKKGMILINLMASPGAGKTTTLVRTIHALKDDYRIGVIEADADGDVDARTIAKTGVKVVQVHTGGSCHMDARMTQKGLESLMETGGLTGENLSAGPVIAGQSDASGITGGPDDRGPSGMPDVVFLENVGNLVCPAEFDVGADLRVMILSTPEGHDKPLKYPLMFQVSDCLLVNKMDVAQVFDFDLDELKRHVDTRNPDLTIFPVSATTGEGFDDWIRWLKEAIGEALQSSAPERRPVSQ